MPNYTNSKIYKIVNDINGEIYIGSTANTLSKRMCCHKYYATKLGKTSKIYSFIRELGVSHFRIVLIEAFQCSNRDELRRKEQQYIDELNPSLNMYGSFRDCPHGRRHNYCLECGGVGMCPHDRRKDQCRICDGSAICEHNNRRASCQVCSPVHCGVCNKTYSQMNIRSHYSTTKHINNSNLTTQI